MVATGVDKLAVEVAEMKVHMGADIKVDKVADMVAEKEEEKK